MNEIINYFSGSLGTAELIATMFSIACVYQLANQKIINFLWGSIGVIIFGWIFYEVKLYSDMMLQLFYFLPIQIFSAWWWYEHRVGKQEMKVKGLTQIDSAIWLSVIAITSALLGFNMMYLTNASFPYWDALTTMMSVVAQYLMMKKIWQSWILWISMDIIAINIYHLKGLEITAGLYLVFFFLANYGLYKWFLSWDGKNV